MQKMSPAAEAAYRHMFNQIMEHDTKNTHAMGNILLNSYNEGLNNTGFPAGRFRHFDKENQEAVITYFQWYGSTWGWYPPGADMDLLKQVWRQRKLMK